MTDRWPDIPYEPWTDSSETLHQWLQIVGKYRLANTPWLNHSWHATFYLTTRGLTTSAIHCADKSLQVDFDFIDHQLIGAANDGQRGWKRRRGRDERRGERLTPEGKI